MNARHAFFNFKIAKFTNLTIIPIARDSSSRLRRASLVNPTFNRCKTSEEKYGKPTKCETCQNMAYFDKGLEAKKKVSCLAGKNYLLILRGIGILFTQTI